MLAPVVTILLPSRLQTCNLPNATQSFTLLVDQQSAITNGNATTFTQGSNGNFSFTSTGFPTGTWSTTSGSLPSGVTFTDNHDGTATLSGVRGNNSVGVYGITVQCQNGVGSPVTQGFTLTVSMAPTPPTITSAASTTFAEGAAGTFTVLTSGSPSITLTETGVLPSGVTFINNGDGTATISGTPTVTGVFNITIHAVNGIGSATPQAFSLTVTGPPTITSGISAAFMVGVTNTFPVTINWSAPVSALTRSGALPSGIKFVDNGNGTATLSGTPVAGGVGNHTLVFTANNGITPNATRDVHVDDFQLNDGC